MKTILLVYSLALVFFPLIGITFRQDFLALYAIMLSGFLAIVIAGIWTKKQVQKRGEDEVSERTWNLYIALWAEEINAE